MLSLMSVTCEKSNPKYFKVLRKNNMFINVYTSFFLIFDVENIYKIQQFRLCDITYVREFFLVLVQMSALIRWLTRPKYWQGWKPEKCQFKNFGYVREFVLYLFKCSCNSENVRKTADTRGLLKILQVRRRHQYKNFAPFGFSYLKHDKTRTRILKICVPGSLIWSVRNIEFGENLLF